MNRRKLRLAAWAFAWVVLAVALGSEAQQMWRNARQRLRLDAATADWQHRLQRLAAERDAALASAAAAVRDARVTHDANGANSNLQHYLDQIEDLQEVIARAPQAAIPEMRYLTSDDWIKVAVELPALRSDSDYRRALAEVRRAAKAHAVAALRSALLNYPGSTEMLRDTVRDMVKLAPYCSPPLPPEVLARYEIAPRGTKVNGFDIAFREKDALAVDRAYDLLAVIATNASDVWVRPSPLGSTAP